MSGSRGRVSERESSDDADLNFGSIVEYAHATAAERVKRHAIGIRQQMGHPARLALKDDVIAMGVSEFLGEAAFNLLRMLEDSGKGHPPISDDPAVVVSDYGADDLPEATGPEDAGRRSGQKSTKTPA